MAKQKLLIVCCCGLLALVLLILIVMVAARDSTPPKPPQPAKIPPIQQAPASSGPQLVHSQFERVGYFKTGKLRGFTFYVAHANKEDIQAFCAKQKQSYSTGRVLKIHLFDNREHTPDVTHKYYFPESSDQYLVADYFHNPFNGKEGLKWHKDIQGKPEEAK